MQKDLRETQAVFDILGKGIKNIKTVTSSTDHAKEDRDVKHAADSLDELKQYLIKHEELASPHINLLWGNALTDMSKLEFNEESTPTEVLSGFIKPLEKLEKYCSKVSDFLIAEINQVNKV